MMFNRFIQPVRTTIQWSFLFFQLYLGLQFYRFVMAIRNGGAAPYLPRPDGIEGFLPISALVSLKGWLLSGEINPIHPAGLVIFLTVIAVSLLLKRSFCSWICPVGTISELLWKGGFNIFRRNVRPHRWLDVGLRGFKYLFLFFFLFSILVVMSPGRVESFIFSDYNKIA